VSDSEQDLHDWLSGRSVSTPASDSQPPTGPAATPAAPQDLVAEYLAKANAAAAARPNPLVRRPVGEPPAVTGDRVQDYINRHNWLAAQKPNPLRAR
jgi:hypothetical protein